MTFVSTTTYSIKSLKTITHRGDRAIRDEIKRKGIRAEIEEGKTVYNGAALQGVLFVSTLTEDERKARKGAQIARAKYASEAAAKARALRKKKSKANQDERTTDETGK